MKYFLDTEFVEGEQTHGLGILQNSTPPTIDLISLGIITEHGATYYAICKEFNLREAWKRYDVKEGKKVYWLRDNVLFPIWEELVEKYLDDNFTLDEHYAFTYSSLKTLLSIYGKTKREIAIETKEFVYTYMYVKVNEEGGLDALDIPEVEMYGYYSDYDWVVFCWLFGLMSQLPKYFPFYCKDLKQMLDELLAHHPALKQDSKFPKQESEHDALEDAKWTRNLFLFLKKRWKT